MVLTSSGTPIVAYSDTFYGANPLAVLTWDGRDWHALGALGFRAATPESMLLDAASDTPYMAVTDWTNPGQKVTVLSWVNNAWSPVGQESFTPKGMSDYTASLARDAAGALYVSTGDQQNGGRASVMKYA